MCFVLVRTFYVTLLFCFALGAFQGKKGGGEKKPSSAGGLETGVGVTLPAAKFAGTIPDGAASDPGKQSDWPADTFRARDGRRPTGCCEDMEAKPGKSYNYVRVFPPTVLCGLPVSLGPASSQRGVSPAEQQ